MKKINKKNKFYIAKSKGKIPFIMLKLPGIFPVSSNDKSVSKFFKKIH